MGMSTLEDEDVGLLTLSQRSRPIRRRSSSPLTKTIWTASTFDGNSSLNMVLLSMAVSPKATQPCEKSTRTSYPSIYQPAFPQSSNSPPTSPCVEILSQVRLFQPYPWPMRRRPCVSLARQSRKISSFFRNSPKVIDLSHSCAVFPPALTHLRSWGRHSRRSMHQCRRMTELELAWRDSLGSWRLARE